MKVAKIAPKGESSAGADRGGAQGGAATEERFEAGTSSENRALQT